MRIQSRRARTSKGRLSLSAATVARPIVVWPTIRSPLWVQAKWSRQCCRRGLKSMTISPDSGSMPVVRSPLRALHAEQASQRFSSTVRPPRATGMRWSISSGEPMTSSAVRQYPHRWLACRATDSRNAAGMWVVLNSRQGRIEKRGNILPTFLEPRHRLRAHQHGALVLMY